MKITILGSGTSCGVPEIGCKCEVCTSSNLKDKRLRASALVETGEDHILIDCGPDFRAQMLSLEDPSPTALLLTHIHYDHVAGIDDLRPFCKHGAFPIYSEKRVSDELTEKYKYIFQEKKYPGIPRINLNTIHRDPFLVGKTMVVPIRLFHYKLPVLGYRIGNFAYLTDFTVLPEEEMSKLIGVKLIVIDALRIEKHLSHLSLEEAIELGEKLNIPNVYFTHMSHQMGLHVEIEKKLPPNFRLAYDGLELKV